MVYLLSEGSLSLMLVPSYKWMDGDYDKFNYPDPLPQNPYLDQNYRDLSGAELKPIVRPSSEVKIILRDIGWGVNEHTYSHRGVDNAEVKS